MHYNTYSHSPERYYPWNCPEGGPVHAPLALTSAHQRLPTGTGTHVTSLFSRHWHTLGPSAGQDRGRVNAAGVVPKQ